MPKLFPCCVPSSLEERAGRKAVGFTVDKAQMVLQHAGTSRSPSRQIFIPCILSHRQIACGSSPE